MARRMYSARRMGAMQSGGALMASPFVFWKFLGFVALLAIAAVIFVYGGFLLVGIWAMYRWRLALQRNPSPPPGLSNNPWSPMYRRPAA